MEKFNEHSSNQNSFARGIQGDLGDGLDLTSTRDYVMLNKKLRNVGNPELNTDAATKKYVDEKLTNTQDLSTYLKKDGSVIINLEDPPRFK